MVKLRSPCTGAVLERDGHALCAAGERWPVVDGIAFLRADRRELAHAALACLDSRDEAEAAALLLGDQDNWARTPPPSLEARRHLVAHRDDASFREAMDLLAMGPVATYFAHRWSDHTFLSGLALAQGYWPPPLGGVLELACGAGHFLPKFGAGAVGADLVFAKLWLARHFVAQEAELVCFDAAQPWPLADQGLGMVFCHDAFYFLSEKPFVAREMMRVASRVLVGHMHNALMENLSAGEPLTPAGYAALFPGAVLFDDAELTLALLDARPPVVAAPERLAHAAALALAWPGAAPGPAVGAVTTASAGARLRRNPLYLDGRIAWPSKRYEAEYGQLATYRQETDAPAWAISGQDAATDAMAHRRELLELPERW